MTAFCSAAVSGVKRLVGDLPGNLYRRIGDRAAGVGQCDGAAAAVVRIRAGGDQVAHLEPVHHAFGRGGVKIDQAPELVLRTRSHLAQLGERRELRLRQPLDDPRHEDRRMPLHRDPQQEADLIVEPILGFGGGSGAGSHGYTDSRRRWAATSRGELGHGAVPLQLALLQHIGAVADEFGEMDVLLGQEHREAFLLELDDGVGHLLDDDRRDAFGGLVEQHQQRIAHQRASDRQHLLLTAAHMGAAAVGHAAEIGKDREQLFRRP